MNALNSNPSHGHQMLTKFSMVSHQNSLRVFTSLNKFFNNNKDNIILCMNLFLKVNVFRSCTKTF